VHIGLDGDRCWWLAADFDGPEAVFDALMYLKPPGHFRYRRRWCSPSGSHT